MTLGPSLTRRALPTAIILLILAAVAFGAYTYFYEDYFWSLNAAKWTINSSGSGLQIRSPGLYGFGTLVYRDPIPDGTDEYEVFTRMYFGGNSAWFYHLHRASSDANIGSGTGTQYLSLEFSGVTNNNGMACTLYLYRKDAGGKTMLASTSTPCGDGMTMRSFTNNYGGGISVFAFINDIQVLAAWTNPLTGGKPGVGVGSGFSGAYLESAKLGPRDRVAPNQLSSTAVQRSIYPTIIDLKWPSPGDDANGVGIRGYQVFQDGADKGVTTLPSFTAQGLATGSAHSFTIYPVDLHNNWGYGAVLNITTTTTAPSTQFRTLPARSGIRPTGAYWGAGGEQIDSKRIANPC